MTGLLSGQLASAIASGFKGKLLNGVLRKTVVTGRDEYGDITTSTVDTAVQGLQDSYSALIKVAAGIPAEDVKILLITGLCAELPAIGDKIQMSGEWFAVRNIVRDPAGATLECQSYKVTVA